MYIYCESSPVLWADPVGYIRGTFLGGEVSDTYENIGRRGAVSGGISFSCVCNGCKLECTFHVTATIQLLHQSDPYWDIGMLDLAYGKQLNRESRRELVHAHERDHQKTYEEFYLFNRGKLEEEEKRIFDSDDDCLQRIKKIYAQLRVNIQKAEEHSNTFDTERWHSGNHYRLNPLSNQSWLLD